MENEKQSENDYTEFVNLLNKHKVDYLVVGGYAVMFHTLIPRETKDIDFWIRPTKKNAVRQLRNSAVWNLKKKTYWKRARFVI